MPEYKEKNTLFYRGKQAFRFDFSVSSISSDGAILLTEKAEKNRADKGLPLTGPRLLQSFLYQLHL